MCSQESYFKSTVRTVIALANRVQGQSYTFEPSTTYLYLVLVSTFVFKLAFSLSRVKEVFYASSIICTSVQNNEKPPANFENAIACFWLL